MVPDESCMASTSRLEPAASVKRILPWLVALAFFMESPDTTVDNCPERCKSSIWFESHQGSLFFQIEQETFLFSSL
jgi:hypothetical protein